MSLLLKPEIESFRDHTESVDERVEWQAIIKGNPKPEVIWLKDGTQLQKNEHYDMEEDKRNCKYKLIIDKLSLEDEGTYTVVAKNYLGEANAAATLTPHSKYIKFSAIYQKWPFPSNFSIKRDIDHNKYILN